MLAFLLVSVRIFARSICFLVWVFMATVTAYDGVPGSETGMKESRLDRIEWTKECSANKKIVTYLLNRSEEFRVLCELRQG